ncbi:MAG: glycosyltransferase family 2 protein [Thermodesulfobacteriota bacterium]|nr:glycosyltransferase family 2 protein [Thermodesulfobacteriota bacterium]
MTSQNLNKFVSIGFPVYNARGQIARAMDSLLAQSHANFELILADNASTDGTAEICREYAARDSRIRFYANEQNIGMFKNFSQVLAKAKGEYFMWGAADDYWHPEFVATLLAELENNPESGVAMCAARRVRPDETFIDEIRFNGSLNPNEKSNLAMSLAMISSVKYNLYIYGLFRRDILARAIVNSREMPSSERWLLRRLALARGFRYVDEILYVRTNHRIHFSKRYPGDSYGQAKRGSEAKMIDLRPLADMFSKVIRANYIPPGRKIFLPLILAKLFCFKLKWSLILAWRNRFKQSASPGAEAAIKK